MSNSFYYSVEEDHSNEVQEAYFLYAFFVWAYKEEVWIGDKEPNNFDLVNFSINEK